jgi:predicted transcriptional regulator
VRDEKSKRSRIDLYAKVLEVIRQYPEGGRITRISYGVGVPIDRLKIMVDALCSYGLVQQLIEYDGAYFGVTARGLEFLETYWKMKRFLAAFGGRS